MSNNNTNQIKPIPECDPCNFEKYKLVIQARNFHYDNFNKWMTYFYVATGALFVGYSQIVSEEKHDQNILLYITVLGYVISLLWYWSAKGYYYWNINFISLINYYEEKILKFKKTERIYFVFANKKTQNNFESPISGANISTSKVAILFAFIITNAWGFLFLYEYSKKNKFFDLNCVYFLLVILLTIVLTASIPKIFLKSNISSMFNLKYGKIKKNKKENQHNDISNNNGEATFN